MNLAYCYVGGGSAHGPVIDFVQILWPRPGCLLWLMHGQSTVPFANWHFQIVESVQIRVTRKTRKALVVQVVVPGRHRSRRLPSNRIRRHRSIALRMSSVSHSL